ncbi:hypothetical protein Q8F55_008408 [Vanrija albida]|uniref:histidine kinase n=1 Tax=Vanrija albida TaxID=181172 RepID=A0ABR3PX33_9TREE
MSGRRPPPWPPADDAMHDKTSPLAEGRRCRTDQMKDWLRRLATDPTTAPGSTHDSHFSDPDPRLGAEKAWRRNIGRSEGSVGPRPGSPGPISYVVVDADYTTLGQAPDKSPATPSVGIASPQTRRSIEGRSATFSTAGSVAYRSPGIGSFAWFKLIFQLRIWPAIVYFANPRFLDDKKEALYRKEAWFTEKSGAIFSSFLLLINWVSYCALMKKPTKFQLYSYVILCGVPALPLLPMLILNWPIRRSLLYRCSYQLCLMVSVWSWSFLLAAEMYICGFGTPGNDCDIRKFTSQSGYVVGLPTLGLLFMGQNRFVHLICTFGTSIYWLLTSSTQEGGIPLDYWRSPIGFVIYHTFLIGLSFLRERSGRQLFELREELKSQYRAVQAAQVMERKAEQSKERFVSYIFHEVRVPLNTALLAVQNLRGEGVFHNLHEDKSDMVHGLSSSLSLMENVLDDVLSFNRMESGMFVLTSRPFDFHKAMQLIALAHRLQAQSAGIDLLFNWDPRISALPLLLGDEMRLRQVASNLVSNAIKFTPKGSVTITTSIVRSVPPADKAPGELEEASAKAFIEDLEKGDIDVEIARLSVGSQPAGTSTAMSSEPSGEYKVVDDDPAKWVVVRVEVADTGVGIKEEDMEEGRLFSPYSQSEVGRRQGGKGSGLGLALVRQIVQLAGGRLGVDSQVGVGTTVWFECPFALAGPNHLTPVLGPRQQPPTPPMRCAPLPSPPISLSRPPVSRRAPAFIPIPAAALADTPASATPTVSPGSPTSPLTLRYPMGVSDGSPMWDVPPPFVRGHSVESVPMTALSSAPTTPAATRVVSDPMASAQPAGTRLRTLVVDDDKLTRKLMSRMLSRLGHDVDNADNGKTALDLIMSEYSQGRFYDVVFLDNQMPQMTGVEVVRALRQAQLGVFVVGCTGNALREDQREYLEAGANQLLPKPIHQSSIELILEEARQRRAA